MTCRFSKAVIKTMVQPDVLVVCDRDKIIKARVVGAPDLIIEVLKVPVAIWDNKCEVDFKDIYEKISFLYDL